MSSDEDQRRLDAAFAEARDELSRILEAAAQASVDGTIGDLRHQVGPFKIAGADVEVTIRNLQLVSGEETAAERPAHQPQPVARPRRGRPDGPVRTAVLQAFSDLGTGDTLTTDQVRDALVVTGVETTADNVHQQLRRLVQAGLLERADRGLYRRAADLPRN